MKKEIEEKNKQSASEAIQFSCLIEQVKANKDRTLTIKLETQELDAEETSRIFSLMGLQFWVAMAELPIQTVDIPDFIPEFSGQKSPSKRLYDRMFVYYKQTHKGDSVGFRAWYESALEKIGDTYLQKLQ